MRGFRGLLLLVLVAVAAVAGSACGSGQEEVVVTPRTPPDEIVEAAGYSGVHSGEFEAFFIIDNRTAQERDRFRFTGGFAKWGEEEPPQVEVTFQSQGVISGSPYIDFDAFLKLQPTRAQLTYGPAYKEQPYRPDPSMFKELRAKFKEAQAEEGKGYLGACPEAAKGESLGALVEEFAVKGTRKEADGTPVVVLSGNLDVLGLMHLLGRLAEDPNCGAQMRAIGLPPAKGIETAAAELKRGLMKSKLTLAVDRRGVIHETRAEAEFRNSNDQRIELELIFAMHDVNRNFEVRIAPEGRPLGRLLAMFGISPAMAREADGSRAVLGFLEGLGGGMIGRVPVSDASPR